MTYVAQKNFTIKGGIVVAFEAYLKKMKGVGYDIGDGETCGAALIGFMDLELSAQLDLLKQARIFDLRLGRVSACTDVEAREVVSRASQDTVSNDMPVTKDTRQKKTGT